MLLRLETQRPSMNTSAESSNCRKRRKVTAEDPTLSYPAVIVAKEPVLAGAVSHPVSKGRKKAHGRSTGRTATDRQLHGCKGTISHKRSRRHSCINNEL